MAALLVSAALVACGAIAAWIALDRRERRLLKALALAPGLTFGSLSLGLFACLSVGLPRSWCPIVAAGIAGVVVFLCRVTSPPRDESDLNIRTRRRMRRLWLTSALLVALVAVGLAVRWVELASIRPHGTSDAVFIWNKNARALHRADSGVQEVFREMEIGHPEYPLMLSGALAAQYGVLGGDQPEFGQATSLAFLIGIAMLIYLTASRLAAPGLGMAAVAVYLSTPSVWKWAFSQCADFLVAYFALAAVSGLASWFDPESDDRWPPAVIGLCIGLLPWTKDEGAVVMLVVVAAFAVVLIDRRLRPSRSATDAKKLWIGLGLGAMPGIAALAVHKIFWVRPRQIMDVFTGDLPGRLSDLERWAVIALAFLEQWNPVYSAGSWGLVWIAVAVAVAIRVRGVARSPGALLVALAASFALAGFFLVYLASPQPVERIMAASLQRLLLQVYPLVVVWLFAVGLAPIRCQALEP